MKTGNGTTALYGNSSFTGGLRIDPGTISIGGDAALGSSSGTTTWDGLTANVIFSDSGTLQASGVFALSPSRTIAICTGDGHIRHARLHASIGGPVSGSGRLAKIGGGALILSGSNTYSGGTRVDSGLLQVTNMESLPEGGSLTVGAGATMVFDPTVVGTPVAGDACRIAAAGKSCPARFPAGRPGPFGGRLAGGSRPGGLSFMVVYWPQSGSMQ